MKTLSKTMLLAAITVMMFASVYASVALEEADAAKSKKDKLKSVKAKKGWLAHSKYK